MTEVKSAYWETEHVAKEIQAGENRIRISICMKKGRTWVSIREWYKSVTGEYLPGKHGLAVPIDSVGQLDEFIETFGAIKDTLTVTPK